MTTIDQDRRERDEEEKEERRRRARLLLARLRHRIDQLCGVVRRGDELIQTAQDIAADIRKITDSPELRALLPEPLQAGLVRASDALDRADQYLAQADSYTQMPSAICSETLDAIDAADQALQGEIPEPYLRRLWNHAASRLTTINRWKAGLVAMAVAAAATISGVLLAYLGGGGASYAPVSGVYILSAPSAMEAGDRAQLQSHVEGEGGAPLNDFVTVVWSSSDESVLVVSDSGLVEALAPGEASVFAEANGVTGEAPIRVTLPQPVATVTAVPPATPTSSVASPTPLPSPTSASPPPLIVTTVDVYPTVLALGVGEDAQLQAIPRDARGATVSNAHITWKSGDPGIVTVTQNGVVHGIGTGSTRVVASAGSVSSAVLIRVTRPTLPDLIVTLSPTRPKQSCGTNSVVLQCALTVFLTVTNSGVAPSPATTVRVTTDNQLFGSAEVAPLSPSESSSIAVTTNAGTSCFTPNCTIVAEVDPDAVVPESNETNNRDQRLYAG